MKQLTTEYKKVTTTMEEFSKLTKRFQKEMTEFMNNLNVQGFQQHQNEENDKALNRGEMIYDQFIGTKARCETVMQTRKEIEATMTSLTEMFKAFDGEMQKQQKTLFLTCT